jgi:hypothetical protein
LPSIEAGKQHTGFTIILPAGSLVTNGRQQIRFTAGDGNMLEKRPHFWLSVAATIVLLGWVWMSGGTPPNIHAVTPQADAQAVQQGAIASWHAARAAALIFDLIVYIAAIVLIWSHALLWDKETLSSKTA